MRLSSWASWAERIAGRCKANPDPVIVAGLVLLGFAVALVAHVPVGVALIAFLPALPMTATFLFEAVGLHDFGRQYQLPVTFGHYVKLIAGGPLYQLILAWAALRAVWREFRGRKDWELTKHVGAHLAVEAEAGA